MKGTESTDLLQLHIIRYHIRNIYHITTTISETFEITRPPKIQFSFLFPFSPHPPHLLFSSPSPSLSPSLLTFHFPSYLASPVLPIPSPPIPIHPPFFLLPCPIPPIPFPPTHPLSSPSPPPPLPLSPPPLPLSLMHRSPSPLYHHTVCGF